MKDSINAIWITGASSGIGKAIAKEFADKNEVVIATARRKNLINNLKKDLGNKSNNLIPIELDIKDSKSVQSFYEKISEKYFITTLINNAGSTSFNSAEMDTIGEIKNIIDTNLLGAIFAIKSVLPEMIKKNNGTIINILSVVTKKIFLNSSVYSAAKNGLLAYTNVLREEVRKNNIRIINVSPGATKTSIWPNFVLEKHSHRMMTPEDIAKLIYSLFSLKSNLVAEEIVVRPIQGDL